MILCGHSLGGYLGVAYAEKYPQRLERLVLISPVRYIREMGYVYRRNNKRQKYLKAEKDKRQAQTIFTIT